MFSLSNIGSSDCQTNRLVSLTRDGYLVFNDLSGGRDRYNVLANVDYMLFPIFVNRSSDN